GRFGGGAGGPHGVMEGLGGDHAALDTVGLQRRFDAPHNFGLPVAAESFGGDNVGIVGGPIADPDFTPFSDDFFESDRRTRGRVEERLALIGGGPLGAGDKILAAFFG